MDERTRPTSALGFALKFGRSAVPAVTARFDALPPVVRLTVAILISLTLWVVIILGFREASGIEE